MLRISKISMDMPFLYFKCIKTQLTLPGDFRSWESHKLCRPSLNGPFEHVERFRNLKFAVKRITDIQSTVLSSSEDTAAIHLAFK